MLVSLPSLSGPKRGCIWVSLGGAGPARDQRLRGGGGEGVAMTASFRFFAFLRFAPSSFSPRSRRARADAPASLGSRNRVWGEPVPPIWTATPPFSVNNTAPTQPPTRTHIPQGMLRGQAGGGRRVPPPRPRKRAMEQFTAAASSWSSFLSGDKRRGYKPVAAQDAPPAGSSLFLWARQGPRSGPMAPLPPQGAKAERPGDKRRDQGWGADPRPAPAASLPPCMVFCAREELGVRKSRIFPRRYG